jgi:steroid delta-isomerase-like uncharacterized protein
MKILSTFLVILVLVTFIGCDKTNSSTDLKDKLDKYLVYWNTLNFNGINEILSEDFELIESPKFEPQKGIEAFKQSLLATHKDYPDFHLVINEIIYDKNKIACIWTVTATARAQNGSTSTGKPIKISGISVLHFKDGKIKDEWIAENDYYWLQQLGYSFVPPSPDTKK